MITSWRRTRLLAPVLFAVAACSEPTAPSAPRIRTDVGSPLSTGAGHYHVEFRAWIPQYWVVDPSVGGLPITYAQSLLTQNFSNCWNPGWLAPITGVYSRFIGDNHGSYDGNYRSSTTVDFDWDGSNIANYTTNFYVGTSHRDLLYAWPGGLWWSGGSTECTEARTPNLYYPASSASGPNFTSATMASDPFLPTPLATPLFGRLWGGFSGANLTLTWSTGQFPSFGVRVQGPFGSYTKTVMDASGLGSDISSPTFIPTIAAGLNCWVVSCNYSSVTIPVGAPPAPSGNTIYPGQALIQNTSQSTLWSSDGRFLVTMQSDGNFCLYWNGVRVLWCAPGTYHHGYEAIMQSDGNFAVYDAGGSYVWGTYNGNIRAVQPGSYITMQNDGNFVEYGSTGASWASNTCCH